MIGKNISRNPEIHLLSLVLQTGRIVMMEAKGVTGHHFSTVDGKDLYAWVQAKRAEAGGILPTLAEALDKFPLIGIGYPTPREGDTLPDEIDRYIRQVSDAYQRGQLAKVHTMLAAAMRPGADFDPVVLREMLSQRLGNIAPPTAGEEPLSLLGSGERLLHSYRTREAGVEVGIPYPFATLQQSLKGMEGGDVVMIFGPTKGGKTWLAMKMLCHAWLRGAPCLIVSGEMGSEEMMKRCASLLARTSFEQIMDGHIEDPEAELRYINMLQQLATAPGQVRELGAPPRDCKFVGIDLLKGRPATTSTIRAYARQFKPEFIVIDAVYLMADIRGRIGCEAEVQSAIADELKRLAAEIGVPLVCVTQSNLRRVAEKGWSARSQNVNAALAYSQSYAANMSAGLYCQIGMNPLNPGQYTLCVTTTANRKARVPSPICLAYNPGVLEFLYDDADVELCVKTREDYERKKAEEKMNRAAQNNPTIGAPAGDGKGKASMPNIIR